VSYVQELFETLCPGCIAAFNGGFPDFNVEVLKKKWKGPGHCLRCNSVMQGAEISGAQEDRSKCGDV